MKPKKSKLVQLWKKHEDLFTGKVGHCTNSKVELRFKEGVRKLHQSELHGVAETHKKLMRDFMQCMCEQKVLLKEDLAEHLSLFFARASME